MKTAIFFRDGEFYPIELLDPKSCGRTLEQQAADNAAINPGTILVETTDGEILWRKTA